MAFPSHSRHFKSDSSISVDDMIEWSDEEQPMEEEQAPHLLGSISAMDSFGMTEDRSSHGPPHYSSLAASTGGTAMILQGDDPLSRRDSVLNPSPLVLSVRKIHTDEDASVESSSSTFPTTVAIHTPKAPTHLISMPPPTRFSKIDHQAPRRVSDGSDNMMVDEQSGTPCPTTSSSSSNKTSHRRSTHRRDSVDSLPTSRDLDDVIMSFHVLA